MNLSRNLSYYPKMEHDSKITRGEEKFIGNEVKLAFFEKRADTWCIWFYVHQDLMDKDMILQCFIDQDVLNDELDAVLWKSSYNMPNLSMNKMREAMMYKDNMASNRIFQTIFNFKLDAHNQYYYTTYAYRAVGIKQYEIRKIVFRLEEYLKLRMFFDALFIDHTDYTEVFSNAMLSNLIVERMDEAKLDGSTIVDYKEQDGKYKGIIYSHYTFNTGPTFFKVNWVLMFTEDRPFDSNILMEPLDYKIYMAEFATHPTLADTVFDQENKLLYILYTAMDGRYFVLKLREDVYTKTNFVDGYNAIFKEDYIKFLKGDYHEENVHNHSTEPGDVGSDSCS